MLIDLLRRMGAVKAEYKVYDNYIIFSVYGLFDRTSEVLRSPLKRYLTESISPVIITWYSQKYTFIIPKDIAIELHVSRLGSSWGYLTYDNICINDTAFKNASLKLYNILNSLSITRIIYAIYFSVNTPIIILNATDTKTKKRIENSYKNIEVKESGSYLYLYVSLNANRSKSHIEEPKIIIDPEINNKLEFIMAYRIDHKLINNSHIQVAFDEIVKFCKNNATSLNKANIRERVLKVLDDLYETCQKEVETKESLEMLKLQAELDGIELFLGDRS